MKACACNFGDQAKNGRIAAGDYVGAGELFRTAKQIFYSLGKFVNVERLGEVVVRSSTKGDYLAVAVIQCGDDNNVTEGCYGLISLFITIPEYLFYSPGNRSSEIALSNCKSGACKARNDKKSAFFSLFLVDFL